MRPEDKIEIIHTARNILCAETHEDSVARMVDLLDVLGVIPGHMFRKAFEAAAGEVHPSAYVQSYYQNLDLMFNQKIEDLRVELDKEAKENE